MRLCAEKGGIIGINGVGPFLAGGDPSADNIARCVDYVAKLVGTHRVGLSLDYCFDDAEVLEYMRSNPKLFGADATATSRKAAFAPPETTPQIAEALRAMRYAEADVAKIMGGNWLRFARDFWK
jgi:membrane dipeptidase